MISLALCNRRIDPNRPYYRIGRPSIFGNPFVLNNSSVRERDRVCDQYETYFHQSLEHFDDAVNEMLDQALQHGSLQLICYCAPLRCHGDTIIEHLKNKLMEAGYEVQTTREQSQ